MSDPTNEEQTPAAEPNARSNRIRLLGRGPHGEVWLYHHLGAEEVRKYLAPELDASAAFREAMQTRAIQDPGIVRVHEVVADRNGNALRMEFVPGRDLSTTVDDEGLLDAESAASLFASLAEALDAAHRRGVLHRGITPRNVIVRPDGSGVFTDFGIRAQLAPYHGDAFLAPEVRGGEAATRAADVWSLGAVLYFACGGMAPSIEGSLVPLPEVQPRVPRDFWRLLASMLADSPGDRPPAAAVARDLRQYVNCLVCPDCAQVFRFESVTGACPEPRCGSPRAQMLRDALVARRAAERAIANCSFREATPLLAAARQAFTALGDDPAVAELEATGNTIGNLEGEHTAVAQAITTSLANDRLLECAVQLGAARRRFSRSPQLRALRARLRQGLAAVHREAPERVQVELRARRFAAARAIVAQVEGILGEQLPAAELAAALGRPPDNLLWLSNEVERTERQYSSELHRAQQAVLDFRYSDAIDAYTRLERDFPDASNRQLLDALSRAPADLAQANRHSDDLLRQLAHDPASGEGHKNLDLEATRSACRRLLSHFDPDQHATYRVFVERSDLVADAALAIRKYVRSRMEQAEAAREQRRLFEELDHLGTACHLVVQTDLYDLHEREHVLARYRQTSAAAERARNLHADAGAALARRDPALAQTKLRELRELAPRAFADFDELVQRVETSLARIRHLRAEVVRGFGRAGASVDVPALAATLTLAEELYGLSDDDARRSADAETIRVLSEFLHQTQDQCQTAARGAEGVTTEVIPLLYRAMMPILRAMPIDAWRRLLAGDSALRRQVCAVAEAALPSGDGDCETTLRDGKAWQRFFAAEPAADLLAAAVPPLGFPHPTLVLAQRLHRAMVGADRFQRGLFRNDAEDLMRAVFALAPPSLHEGLATAESELQRLGKQDSVALRLHGLQRRVVALVPVLLAAATAAVGAFHYGQHRGRTDALATVATHLLPDVDATGVAAAAVTDPAVVHSLARLAIIGEITERTARSDRVETWSDLGDALRIPLPAALPEHLKRAADQLGQQLAGRTITAVAERPAEVSDLPRALRGLRTAFALLRDTAAMDALDRIGPLLAQSSTTHDSEVPAWRSALDVVDAVPSIPRRNVLRVVARTHFLGRLVQVAERVQGGEVSQLLAATRVPCYVLARTAAVAHAGEELPQLARR